MSNSLAFRIKLFIEHYIMTDEYQGYGGYEDALENAVDYLYSLCTTDAEREIVKAIVSLEEH